MRKIKFINNQIYHIFNRGTEKRNIFLDELDFLRFIHDLFEFNDSNQVKPSNTRLQIRNPRAAEQKNLCQCLEAEPPNVYPNILQSAKRKLLVEILSFCLMPNHFHALFRQLQEGGVPKFMQKLGTGYTMYFNQKYKRSGHLFQGKFKAVAVEHDRQLLHLPYYIHLNPLDLKYPGWRKNELPNHKNAMKFLETYRWSSYPDYIGKKNFPSVTERGFLTKFLGGAKQHNKDIRKWLKEREKNLNIMGDITLE